MTDIKIENIGDPSIKQQLFDLVSTLISKRGCNQSIAAQILCVDQPKISVIKRGITHGFSMAKGLIFLQNLGCEVSITIKMPNDE